MLGVALVIAASAFFLPRLRRAPPVGPAQGLVSPTLPPAPPVPTTGLPVPQETPTAQPDSQHRSATVTVTTSAPLRKGAATKGKTAAPDPAPENAPVATPNTPAEPPSPAPIAPPPVPAVTIVETPAIAPPPTAEPPPAARPAPLAPLNPALARVEIGAATSTTGTTASSVNKTIAPLAPKLTACYRTALSHQTQANDEGGVLHVETNEDGVIMEARLDGPLASEAGRCIVAAVRGRRISNVDTGSASADVPLSFKVR
jgi:hypothetical protein